MNNRLRRRTQSCDDNVILKVASNNKTHANQQIHIKNQKSTTYTIHEETDDMMNTACCAMKSTIDVETNGTLSSIDTVVAANTHTLENVCEWASKLLKNG